MANGDHKSPSKSLILRASGELSVSERLLSEADFSFQFLKEGPDDELINDVQVIILAHADEARVKMSDGLAESLGHAVEERVLLCFELAGGLFLMPFQLLNLARGSGV